jgi:hypothetical protein
LEEKDEVREDKGTLLDLLKVLEGIEDSIVLRHNEIVTEKSKGEEKNKWEQMAPFDWLNKYCLLNTPVLLYVTHVLVGFQHCEEFVHFWAKPSSFWPA